MTRRLEYRRDRLNEIGFSRNESVAGGDGVEVFADGDVGEIVLFAPAAITTFRRLFSNLKFHLDILEI